MRPIKEQVGQRGHAPGNSKCGDAGGFGHRHPQEKRGGAEWVATKNTKGHKNGRGYLELPRPGSGVSAGGLIPFPWNLTVRNNEHSFVLKILYRGMLDV